MGNTIFHHFQSIAELLGWTILHSIWQITVVALILKLLLSWTSKNAATIRYGLSMSALFAIVVWSAFTFLEGLSQNTFLEKLATTAATESTATSTIVQLESIFGATTFYQQISDKIVVLAAPFVPSLAILWLLGVSFFASRVITGLFKLHQLSTVGLQAFPKVWESRLIRLKQLSGIDRIVDIRLSTIISVPITYKCLRPIILLPFSLFSQLTDDQIEVLLLHELAHIKRHDYLFNLLQSCIEVVFFYHPLLWWISKNVRSEREHCCDDMVMQIRHQPMLYAQTLTQIQVQHYSLKSKLAMSAKENTGAFSKRIYRLFPQKDPNSKLRNGAAALLLLLLSSGMMAFYPSHSTPLVNPKIVVVHQDTLPPSSQKQATTPSKEEALKVEKEAVVLQAQLVDLEKELHKNVKALKEGQVENKAKQEELKVKAIQLKKELHERATELKILSGNTSSFQHNSFKKELFSLKIPNAEKPLIFVDDQPFTKWKIDTERNLTLDIPTDQIATINVMQGKKALDESGKKVVGDIVEIFTKKYISKEKNKEIEKVKIEENSFTLKQTTTEKKPLTVLNGKVLSKEEDADLQKIEDIAPEEIGHINVLKGAAAIEKYGEDGKDGVVEIYTKGNEPPKTSQAKDKKIMLNGNASKQEGQIEKNIWVKTNDQVDEKSPLFVIDGEKKPITVNGEKYKVTLKSDEIASIEVIKGQAALDKYGEEGKNGVVVIISKKQAKKSSKALKKKKSKKAKKELKTAMKEKKPKAEKPFVKSKIGKPTVFGLSVYPNPTRKLTNVQLNLEKKGNVSVDIININGQVVYNLVNEMLDVGFHDFQWNSDDQPAGNYFVHFNMDGTLISKQIIVKK